MTNKVSKFLALKTAAGKHNFQAGDEVELSEDEAKPLLQGSAVKRIGPEPKAKPKSLPAKREVK